MKRSVANIIREYGPFPNVEAIHGVTYDGQRIWFGVGQQLNALDPGNGQPVRSLNVVADAGTAFDGQYLYQISGDHIQKVDPHDGNIIATIPTPSAENSGLAWGEGSLWVGQYRNRKIHQIDPETGEVLRTLESNRCVTGVTWNGTELWHGTWENDESELRHVNPDTGEVLETIEMPSGTGVSGLESDGNGQFFCGGGGSGKLRTVRRS
ncbi:glutamine cyclotransferase [Halomonas binhaiensis]|uniref:Glutamine cyclotransferase n=1 Tax=Halomonas binhaiensis TaxID=2562282 RepID=A0A5C1NH51_9GAMM|nr:glutamine cyclotransferase [Halomonas binhaiensis]QEM82161.1 glutamine cyclotransferase [Halomonas binhaiensis]